MTKKVKSIYDNIKEPKQEPTQDELRDFVSREVLKSESMLVDDLLKEGKFNYEDIENGSYIACSECGGEVREMTSEEIKEKELDEGAHICENCDFTFGESAVDELDTEYKEIFEWWSCTDWLIKKLAEQGEPILHTDYGDYWGRCCTGQAILLDNVIETIYKG